MSVSICTEPNIIVEATGLVIFSVGLKFKLTIGASITPYSYNIETRFGAVSLFTGANPRMLKVLHYVVSAKNSTDYAQVFE